ncbi:hypothetical protein HPB51_014152 [Rhipicephalus microplus]|uniref:Uncharacterized protein n=1 Tax=Rhipicephalus microplus TaxID=6941 RepID=A0A9J6E217_RHIMP|nr:hypothetical protein HPB51_014152 [Rhipicephalus microplus]
MSSCLARAYRPTEKEQHRSDGDRGSGDRDGRERSRAVNSARPVIHALSERGEFGEPTPCLRVDGTRRDDSPPRRVRLYMAQDVVRPHVSRLFQTLLVCFRDPSWAVRDGQEAFEVVKPKITEGLAGVAKQPAETLHYRDIQGWGAGSGSSATPNIKAMKKLHDNDPALHTNQPAYSCESLAPRAGLPTDWNYRKPSEPWELADGCIHLIAELSQVPQVSTSVAEFLPALSEASRHRHYVHHVVLLETLCSQLPNIVKGVGKRVFKMHIELFLEPIFYSLNCENALTSSAASQCLNQLASLFGPSILRARVEQWNPRYLEQLDANLHIAGL